MKTERAHPLENLSMRPSERVSLCETLDRVLNKGAVVAGELISRSPISTSSTSASR